MADTIVPINEDVQGTGAVEATAPIQGTAATGSGGTPASDTAQLSETAQVSLLQEQGLTVSEIADELGIPQTEVESDLGNVVVAQQAAASTPTQGTAATPYSQVAGV